MAPSRYDDSEIKFRVAMKRIEQRGREIQRKQELKDKLDSYKKPRKKIPTTKWIVLYLFIIMNVVLAYAMYTMFIFRDLSALPILITDIAAQVLTFLIYASKSYMENKSEAEHELERDKLNSNNNNLNNEPVG